MTFANNTFPQAGDPDDAVRFAQQAGHEILVDYVQSGLSVTADFTNNLASVTEGVCHVSQGSDTATSDGTEVRNLGFAVQKEAESVTLSSSGVEHIVVDPILGVNDNPVIDIYDNPGNAPDTSLKLAEIDNDAETVTEKNRNPSATVETLVVKDNLDLQGSGGGVATLDQNGKLQSSQVPDLSITEVTTVADESGRLGLTDIEEGDVAIQTDNEKSYIFTGGDPSTNADWEVIGGGLDADDVINAVDNKTTNTEISGSAFSFDSTVGSSESYTIKNDGSVVLAGPFEVDGTVKIEGNGRLKVI